MSEEKEKIKVSPLWCDCYQKVEDDNACVEIELPGVKKRDISLSMTDQGFSLKAPKEDMEYVGAWTCPVDSSKAKEKYDNGLLMIVAPLKPGPPSKEIKIE